MCDQLIRLIKEFNLTDTTTKEEIFALYDLIYKDRANLVKEYPTSLDYHREFVSQLKKMEAHRQYLIAKAYWVKRRVKEGYYDNTFIKDIMDMNELSELTSLQLLQHPILIYITHLGKLYVDTYRRKGPPFHGTDNKQKLKVFYIRKKARNNYYTEPFDNKVILALSTPQLMEHDVYKVSNSIGTIKKKKDKSRKR